MKLQNYPLCFTRKTDCLLEAAIGIETFMLHECEAAGVDAYSWEFYAATIMVFPVFFGTRSPRLIADVLGIEPAHVEFAVKNLRASPPTAIWRGWRIHHSGWFEEGLQSRVCFWLDAGVAAGGYWRYADENGYSFGIRKEKQSTCLVEVNPDVFEWLVSERQASA